MSCSKAAITVTSLEPVTISEQKLSSDYGNRNTGFDAKMRTLKTVLELTYAFPNVIACPSLLEELDQVIGDLLGVQT